MEKYPKIETLLNRDEKTFGVIKGSWRLPEFEYLRNNMWLWTEKIDGTNIRVDWIKPSDEAEGKIVFGGRTDNAQIPAFLLEKLMGLFPTKKFLELYPDIDMALYGEGFGARIQKGGGNYISDGVDFALFDVRIQEWWLERENIEDIATKLGIGTVPIINEGTLEEAITIMEDGFESKWGTFLMEGFVIRPKISLANRRGHRILGKIKHKDFK